MHPDERFSRMTSSITLLRLDQIYIYINTNFSNRISCYEFLVWINSRKNKWKFQNPECAYLHVYRLFCLISWYEQNIRYRRGEKGVIKSGTTEGRNFNDTTLSSSRACLEEASLLAQNGRGPIYYSGGTQRTPNGPDVAHRRKLREPRTIFLQKLQRPRHSTPYSNAAISPILLNITITYARNAAYNFRKTYSRKNCAQSLRQCSAAIRDLVSRGR